MIARDFLLERGERFGVLMIDILLFVGTLSMICWFFTNSAYWGVMVLVVATSLFESDLKALRTLEELRRKADV